jgi:hypothetical protein
MPGKTGWLVLLAVLATSVSPALATTLSFAGADAYGRSAQAVFTFDSSGNLTARLTNTATAGATDGKSVVLTAVFFDLIPQTTLTPHTALLAPGSIVINGPQPTGGVVGGEWAYAYDPDGDLAWGGGQGISSAGFGLFGKANFDGSNLAGPVSVDGLQYGIVGTGSGFTQVPVIQNAVDFTLTWDPNVTIIGVWGVVFQYGSDLVEPHFVPGAGGTEPPIPEPLTMLGLLSAVGGVGSYLRRRLA